MFFYKLALLLAVAGHALAVNITFNNVNNITAQELFAIPPGPYDGACQSTCNAAMMMVNSCGPSDNACLCAGNTANSILACQQCLFKFFIDTNTVPADPKLGASTAVSGYVSACNAEADHNTTAVLALALAPQLEMQGLRVEVLNTPATVVVVGFGGIMGIALLFIMSTLS